ncbi:MAG: dephospho-CoA kinase, partial [Spirochaetes bacterium]|nr:dephospho-CoA kinase [Spirochaetota bacterium]
MKIGITGIYASGKGTVCAMFEQLGAKVIDTDILAREVVEPGTRGLELYIKEFGGKILNNDGTLNRRVLANIVFKDPQKVKLINNILHPLIHQKMLSIINSAPNEIYMINTPLLFETDFHKFMDYNITVFANNDQVIERGIIRDNITETEILDRLNNQISLNEKIKLADYVIDNSSTTENTKRQVIEIW